MQWLLNLDVPDLPAAVAFYRRAFGLTVGRELFEGTVVEMLGAAVPLYLLHKATALDPAHGGAYSATTAGTGCRCTWT